MKLAILGAGMIVKDFLSMVHQIPEIKLQAIIGTEKDIETMEIFKEQHTIGNIYTDFENCLKKSDIDTVYVALPNHLHYAYAKKALEYGKNVICEKPFTLKLSEMKELRQLSEEKKVVLIEAITNQYLANYREIKQQISELGDLKLIECNYSQYSSRYDLFKAGTVLPAFNPKMGGGALMDINIYNIHFVVGLLGMPEKVTYSANIARGIDTSGILSLDYKDTKVVCIGAKDSTAPIRSTIQGDQGSIIINGPTNVVDSFDKKMNKEESQHVDAKVNQHRMFEEFSTFAQVIKNHDMTFVEEQLDHSQKVMEIVELALADADICLGD